MANIFVTFLFFIFGLTAANVSGTQAKAKDTERISDLNAIATSLEIYYNENGYYPAKAIDDGELISIDPESFIDPDGDAFYSSDSDYTYRPGGCDENNGQCTSYILEARLSDGTIEKEVSLNQ